MLNRLQMIGDNIFAIRISALFIFGISDFYDNKKRLLEVIQFDVRKLFQYMQVELLEEDLEKMEAAVKEIHQKVGEDWEDAFWERN